MTAEARIAILRDAAYRTSQEAHLLARVAESGFSTEFFESIQSFIDACLKRDSDRPAGLIRWEENGGLYGDLNAYMRLTQFLYQHRIAPITVDFAFWDHYNGFTFDLVDPDNRSSIYRHWEQLPETLEYDSLPGRTGNEIRNIQATYAAQSRSEADHSSYSVAVFNQSALRRCQIRDFKNTFPQTVAEWNSRIANTLGTRALFKRMPSPPLGGFDYPENARVVIHDQARGLEQNANVATHAKYCLTNSSGVLNEFVVADIPVVVTGKHRYSDLGVFYEMKFWEDLAEKSLDDSWTPPIHKTKRTKFVHWYLQHQALHDEPSDLLKRLVDQFSGLQRKKNIQPESELILPRPVERKSGSCFLTGADCNLENLLPRWLENLRRHHPDEQVVFADFGMSETMKQWCSEHGEVLEIGGRQNCAWHKKPHAIWYCPFETRCWLDIDCEVLAPISEVFTFAKKGLAVTEDWIRGTNWQHAYETMPLATGVVAVHGDCPIVRRWTSISDNPIHRGDQESLNAMLAGDRTGIQIMPREFQWLRLDPERPSNIRVMHWTGVEGKKRIRLNSLSQDDN